MERYRDLLERAVQARAHAYAPYSGSLVGAALLARDGRVYEAGNFELTTYADHGEQLAMAFALADGQRPADLLACAVFVAAQEACVQTARTRQHSMTSCGNCRQALFELNPEMHLVLQAGCGVEVEVFRVGDLLPRAYARERPPLAQAAWASSSHPDGLIREALIARSRSFVPRSCQPVGAAVETQDGRIYAGIRVETSSFSTQAERVALARAMMDGQRSVRRLAVVGGCCEAGEIPGRLSWDALQAVARLSPDVEVILPDGRGGFVTMSVVEALLATC